MAAPTFVATYASAFNNNTSPKTVSVTTQAGDVLVIYAGAENDTVTLATPTGNSLIYDLRQYNTAGATTEIGLWTATDSTGGTSWTLSITNTGSAVQWGFACLVFRNSAGIGASTLASGISTSLTTTQNNSAVVTFLGDYAAVNGSGRAWLAVNGSTPTSGNGLETTYVYSSGAWTAYGAYYPDVGTIGSDTVGLSTPSASYMITAVEVKGLLNGNAPIAWWVA